VGGVATVTLVVSYTDSPKTEGGYHFGGQLHGKGHGYIGVLAGLVKERVVFPPRAKTMACVSNPSGLWRSIMATGWR